MGINGELRMDQYRANKLANELAESLFTNEPNLHPGNLTIGKVRVYAEGLYPELSDEDLETVIQLTYDSNHIY